MISHSSHKNFDRGAVTGASQGEDIARHVPVLLDEVMTALAVEPGEVMVDATFGAGGYSRALLDAGASVYGFDRDPDAIEAASSWSEISASPPRLNLFGERFANMAAVLSAAGVGAVDGVVMDIGVSSMQLDQAERGFAFSADGPLDMRMSQSGESAADFLNSADESAIADVLYHYGEERNSRRIARAIVAARPLRTTGDLAQVVRSASGYRPGIKGGKRHLAKDPATRSFQAVRIHINGELDELKQGLSAAETVLRPGGRLAVVSFHSLEDRIVKRFLRSAAQQSSPSRHMPDMPQDAPVFTDLSKAVRPSEAEIARNPRARSAVLRYARRTDAPARRLAA